MGNIRLILCGIAVVSLLSAGLYIRHMHKEAARVPELVRALNVERAAHLREAEAAQKSLELQNDLHKQLDASRNRNAGLARRLRDLLQSDVSEAPAGPAGTDGAGGSGSGVSDITDDFQRLLDACQNDSIRLGFWQRWYESVPAELK